MRNTCIDIGVPGLENIFLECPYASSILVEGLPGSGKTVMAMHFAYAGLRRGEEVLYISFFENEKEYLEKALNIGLDFRPYIDNNKFHYFHEYVYAERDKILYFIDSILNTIATRQIKRVIIDTIDSLTVALTRDEYRIFLMQLIHKLKEKNATLFLVKEALAREHRSFTYEEILADIVVELSVEHLLDQEIRFFKIIKSRYSNYIPVAVEFTIDSSGMRIYAPYTRILTGKTGRELIATGINGLDKILGGGIPKGSIVSIKGPSGTYKTLIALNIAVHNVLQGKKVIFASYKESKEQIIDYIERLGYSYEEVKDRLTITSINPVYISPRSLYNVLLKLLREGSYEIRIADGAEVVLDLHPPKERLRFLITTLSSIKSLGITEIIVYSQDSDVLKDIYKLDTLSDIVLATRIIIKDNEVKREIGIIKNRGTEALISKFYPIELRKGAINIML